MLYRYEFVPNDASSPRCGILTVLEDIFDDIWKVPGWPFMEDYLPAPNCDMENTISYFTEKGNRKFRKSVKALCQALNETGKGVTRRITIESINPDDVIYKDTYQIILRRKDGC